MNLSRTTPKDFFLHLAAVVALYASAIALINLAFSVVNYYNPDALAGYFYSSSIAWPVSMLIVLVPVLYVIEWLVGRDLLNTPEKRDIWIRRWRTYLTLFLAGAAIITDLIVLINTYLNGEVTVRFVYKILIVLIVTGVIFAYYILSRALESPKVKACKAVLAWSGIIIVLAAIIGGFAAVGSPSHQRALRFDQQRVNDLSNIQYRIVNYWQQKQKLPVELTDLNDSISGFIVPVDPETNANYEYSTKAVMGTINSPSSSSGLSFELCATFDLKSPDNAGRGAANGGYGGVTYPSYAPNIAYPSGGPGNDVWTHDAGHYCFDRTIDQAMYPPNKPIPATLIGA